MQFRESCDAACIENIVIDEGNENMINNEATDEEGYVNDTELGDSSFRDTPGKESFNTSVGDISAGWTPVKYQLGSDLNSISKKLRQHVVKKAVKAIDTVLEKIAPGQSSSLKEECFQLQNKKKEETQLLGCLTQALNEAPRRNAKIQLLSIVCGKDADNQYVYKQNELVDMFEGTTLNDIKKARQDAAKATPGASVEPGKFCRKRLTDAQINHFLDFLQYSDVMQDVVSGTRTVKLSTGQKKQKNKCC